MSATVTVKKLDYIDALRGLAIIGVIMVHTSQYGNSTMPGAITGIVNQGARGVQLFYVASAFTLFLSFKNRISKEVFPIRNFFLRRFFRIAPMYYIGIFYYLMQDGFGPRYWLGDETHITALNIISNITFLHGFNPYWINSLVPGGWSIGVEMTFYAILPFLFLRIKKINHAFLFFILSLFTCFLCQLLFTRFPLINNQALWSNYLGLYFPSQLPIFALGILMYFFINENPGANKFFGVLLILLSSILMLQLGTEIKFTLPNYILIGIAFLILGASATLMLPYFMLFGVILLFLGSRMSFLFPNHIQFGIAFLILGIALSKYRFTLIVNPIINYIGKISFSMYIVQFAVLHWLTHFNCVNYFANSTLNYITRLILVILLTTLVSSLTYTQVELRFQKFGKNIIDRLENKTRVPLI